MPLLLIVFASIAAVPAAFINDGLLTGEVKARGGSYSRADDPAWFWALIGIYAPMIAGIAYIMGDMALS
jgi:hypothetical protein